jgi:hypothetical protein
MSHANRAGVAILCDIQEVAHVFNATKIIIKIPLQKNVRSWLQRQGSIGKKIENACVNNGDNPAGKEMAPLCH